MLANTVENSNEKVGLFHTSYFKQRLNGSTQISKSPDYNSVPEKVEGQWWEYAEGGSYCRISNYEIDPFTTTSEDPKERDWVRGIITKFSYASRRRLNEILNRLNRRSIDPSSILFITLTAPSVGWREVSGKRWKVRLNNFLTQMRKKYKRNRLCGIWRLEFQTKRGAPHFHLITYNVNWIDYTWVADTWSRICGSDIDDIEVSKHREAGTQVARAKNWNNVNQYFSKCLAYIAKDDSEVSPDVYDEGIYEYIKTFGRHWGIIVREELYQLMDIVVGKFTSKDQYWKLRRIVRKYTEKCRYSRRSKLLNSGKISIGDMPKSFQSKIIKLQGNIFKAKRNCKNAVYLKSSMFKKILEWVGLDDDSIREGIVY